MAISRADTLTSSSKQQESFSDFLDSFAKTPFGNQLGRTTNVDAINQSIKNLILTQLGERLFQPLIGSSVYAMLFELNSAAQTTNIEFLIKTAIENYEPRAILNEITVTTDPDSYTYNINIVYIPINTTESVNFNFILTRVR